MAGTDRSLTLEEEGAGFGPGPRIILCRPQLAENVGMVARAMLNCGLTELWLVSPREDWLSDKAIAASSGATAVLRHAVAVDSLDAAIGDLHRVYATTARRRDMVKPVIAPRIATRQLRTEIGAGKRCGILFGPERTGLENDEVSPCDAVVEVPLNPAYCSLNLAQAVLLMGYEWFQEGLDTPPMTPPAPEEELADRKAMEGFVAHLERELVACGFLRLEEKRPTMMRNLRNLFVRAQMTQQEVRTLHGVIAELRWGGRADRPRRNAAGNRQDWSPPEGAGMEPSDGDQG
ncbi:MAG: RNA methyltransferase [Rhodospirillaceae bacterium]